MLAKRHFAPIRAVKQGLVDERHPRTLGIPANLRFSRSFADAERQRENNTGFECRKMAAGLRGLIVGFISSLSALFLGSCSGSPNSAEARWRVMVEVETPEGPRSGSSVWSWRLSKPSVALTNPYDGKFRGEAVAVDLPDGKTLFALVKGQEMAPERQFRELSSPRDGQDRVADIRDIAANVGATKRLPCEPPPQGGGFDYKYDCMMLVSFADIDDPMSVFRVDYHNAAESLDKGYAIKAITLTITDEEVTTGIEERLGWLGDYYGKMLDGRTINTIEAENRLANSLAPIHFSSGISQ